MLERSRTLFVSLASCGAAALAIYWYARASIGIEDVVTVWERMDRPVLLLIFVASAVQIMLAGEKWRALEQILGGRAVSRNRAYRINAMAAGLGQVLPPFAAHSLLRGASNRLATKSGFGRGAATALLDQGLDFAVIMVILPPSILVLMGFEAAAVLVSGVATMAALVIGGGLSALLAKRFAPVRWHRLVHPVTKLDQTPWRWLVVLSICRVANLCVITVLVGASVQAASVGVLSASVAPVALANAVAAVPGGIGVTELSFTGALSAAGTPRNEIILFVVANRTILTPTALLFGAVGVASGAIAGLRFRGAATTTGNIADTPQLVLR